MIPSIRQCIQEMEQDLFQWDLSDIIEVTYAYSQKWEFFLNRTLFEDFTWEKFQENGIFLYQKAQKKLEKKLKSVKKYLQKFHNFDPSPEREILLSMLESVKIILEMTQNSLPFEAIKAGFIQELLSEETMQRIIKNEMYEDSLFWWNIKNSPEESKESVLFFEWLFQEKKSNLSLQEQEQFSTLLTQVKNFLREEYPWIVFEKSVFWNEDFLYHGFEKRIHTDVYKNIFEKVFSLYELDIPVIFEERSSIYDSDTALRFPKSPAYEYLSVGKILGLIQHEIETHYLIARNNSHILGWFRGGNNLQREEGLAVVMVWILAWKQLENLWAYRYLWEILLWEILEWKDFEIFLQLVAKLKWEQNALWVFLRRKRNYPFTFAWVQHKDASYERGVKKIIDWIVSWKDVSLLYAAKVSFEDIENIKSILDEKQISPELPFFIAEMILFLLLENSWNREKFLVYFYKKYSFFSWINILKNFSESQEQKMLELYEIFLPYMK